MTAELSEELLLSELSSKFSVLNNSVKLVGTKADISFVTPMALGLFLGKDGTPSKSCLIA